MNTRGGCAEVTKGGIDEVYNCRGSDGMKVKDDGVAV